MRASQGKLFLFGAFCLLSGFTWVEGDAGQGFAGRVTVADLLGLFIIALAGLKAVRPVSSGIYLPFFFRAYLPLLLLYALSAVFAREPGLALMELLVHAFILVVAVAMLYLFVDSRHEVAPQLLKAVLYAGGTIAAIGLMHFLFFPQWFEGSLGGVSGTFRNTGQAGSYFSVVLCLVVPAMLAGYIRPNYVNVAIMLVIVIALIFTFKRAALIGVSFGVAVMLLRLAVARSGKQRFIAAAVLLFVIPGAFLVSYMLEYALGNVEGVQYRVSRKISADAFEEFAGGFMLENLMATWEAIQISPFLGIGLANAAGLVTDRLEIHGSFFAVAAYGGLVGLVLYCLFLFGLYRQYSRLSGLTERARRYFYYFVPFYIGLVCSWIYTYPLRKREFWIMMVVTAIISYVARDGSRVAGKRGSA